MIKMPDSINTSFYGYMTYYIEIIDQLFSPKLDFDSLTLISWGICERDLGYFPDTMILKKLIFELDSFLNYPTHTFYQCQNNYISYENGLLSGNIERVAGNYDQFFDSMPFNYFLEWYPECALQSGI